MFLFQTSQEYTQASSQSTHTYAATTTASNEQNFAALSSSSSSHGNTASFSNTIAQNHSSNELLSSTALSSSSSSHEAKANMSSQNDTANEVHYSASTHASSSSSSRESRSSAQHLTAEVESTAKMLTDLSNSFNSNGSSDFANDLTSRLMNGFKRTYSTEEEVKREAAKATEPVVDVAVPEAAPKSDGDHERQLEVASPEIFVVEAKPFVRSRRNSSSCGSSVVGVGAGRSASVEPQLMESFDSKQQLDAATTPASSSSSKSKGSVGSSLFKVGGGGESSSVDVPLAFGKRGQSYLIMFSARLVRW